MQTRLRIIVTACVCLMLIVSLGNTSQAVQTAPTTASPEQASNNGPLIHLASQTLDPASVADDLQIASQPSGQPGYYIIQFEGPVSASDIASIKAAGVEVFDYIPDFAFIVKMDDATRQSVEQIPSMRWVGGYQPDYRLAPSLLAKSEDISAVSPAQPRSVNGKQRGSLNMLTTEDITAIITVFRGEALIPIRAEIEKAGGSILDQSQSEWKSKLKVLLPTSALSEVAKINGIRWIEPAPQWTLYNEKSDNIVGIREVWDTHQLYGAGQTVGVADSGLDQGSTDAASLHNDFENGSGVSRVTAIHDLVGDGASDVNSGHGTHVAGSVLGNGHLSGATPSSHTYPETAYTGMAPEANLVFQATENNDTGELSGIPLDLNTLFAQAASSGADLHTNSWGSDAVGMYTGSSEDVDEYIWDHKDFLILFAAANAGADSNADGVVDLYSLGSPASAKNCLTVGASENDRTSEIPYIWGPEYSSPISTDLQADNINGMAPFSSRGPALDGRYKPDIVAPGSWIASVKSSLISGSGWGPIDANYMYMGGTSMATPLTAGAAAVVRQYYTDVEGETPSAALIKATMVNGATDIYPGQYGTGTGQEIDDTRPTNVAGWGRVNVENSIFPTGIRTMAYQDVTPGLNTGTTDAYTYTVTSASEALRVTLAWSDYPGSPVAAGGLVNDLDLSVSGPGGPYYPNNANQRGSNQHISYDDGAANNYWTWETGKYVSVRFTPANYPANLQTGLFYLASTSYPKTFNWYVHSGDDSTGPSTLVASGTSTLHGDGWHAIDFSSANISISSDDFFLTLEIPDSNFAWFYDTDGTIDQRSWDYDSEWTKITTEDYMFNAIVTSADHSTQQDRVNNLIGIDIDTPATGVYTVTVSGYNVPQGPQPYALVVSGAFSQTNTPPVLSDLPDQTLNKGESKNNAINLHAYAYDTHDADADLDFAITNSPPISAGISIDVDDYIDINPTADFTGTVPVVVQVQDTSGLTDTSTFTVTITEIVGRDIYLPLIARCYPLLPKMNPINYTKGAASYTVSWSMPCGAPPSLYEWEIDNNAQFSSPYAETTTGTSYVIELPASGTWYWRVRAQIDGQWTDWSNVESVTVPAYAYVYIDNDTGGTLTVEIVGVAKKSFATGFDNYWRSVAAGTYTIKASARCGSLSESYNLPEGPYLLRYSCSASALATQEKQASTEPSSPMYHFKLTP